MPEAELDALARELDAVLRHVDALRRVDVGGVGAAEAVVDRTAPLRLDREDYDPLRLPIPQIAPAWADPFFCVPSLPRLAPSDGRQGGEE